MNVAEAVSQACSAISKESRLFALFNARVGVEMFFGRLRG